jgi:hypothetical protein
MLVFLLFTLAPYHNADPDRLQFGERKFITENAFVAKLLKPAANDSALLKLQKERARHRALYIEINDDIRFLGISCVPDFTNYVEAQRTLWENLAELAVTPEDKLKCAGLRIVAAKEFERFVAMRVEVGSDPAKNLSEAKAARIGAEIDLLKLKETLKDKK